MRNLNHIFLFLECEWKSAAVRCLIDLHRQHKREFDDPSSNSKEIWQNIVDEMTLKFPGFSVTRSKVCKRSNELIGFSC